MKVNPVEMEMLLTNLLSNAVKYNVDKGRVELEIGATEGQTEIIVRDTGIGMSREEISQLFKEFVRIKNNKTRGIEGSGLGLSIVNSIAEKYKGHIEVKSRPDKGSEFKVIFPRPA